MYFWRLDPLCIEFFVNFQMLLHNLKKPAFSALLKRQPQCRAPPSSSIALPFCNNNRCLSSSAKKDAKATAPVMNFNDTRIALDSKTLEQLLRSYVVFTLCGIKPLVSASEKLVKISYKYLGLGITNFVLRHTFFKHFCAGEDPVSIAPTIKQNEKAGVGSILDYAAESDVTEEEAPKASDVTLAPSSKLEGVMITHNQSRVYDYTTEAQCDHHQKIFEDCIRAVAEVSPTGFAAIKLTALGNPELLKNISIALNELKSLFGSLDTDGDGLVDKDEFLKIFNTEVDGKDVRRYFDEADIDKDGKVDYIEWTNAFKVDQLHLLVEHCTARGVLYNAVLDENERKLFKAFRHRVEALCKLAESLGVRLMIDAEHSYFQPAIDNLTLGLAKRYNKKDSFPVVFSTYQMYLKDSRMRLHTDIQRAISGDFKFAAKLVRGAYMVLEREHAKENNIPDPIHETVQDTHDNYNGAVEEAIKMISEGKPVEIMMATHNQESVERAVTAMQKYDVPPSAGVYFGQLMGMADHLTFTLGASGYKAYKYVPYGKVEEVMPYLIRRAQENSTVATGGAATEINSVKKELWRRFWGKKAK